MIDDAIPPEPGTPADVQRRYSELVAAIMSSEETPAESLTTQNELTRMLLEHEAEMRRMVPDAKDEKKE
jgi:hypothetical protein